MSIWAPLILSVLPTSIGNGSFWLFIAAMSAVSLLGLCAASLEADRETGAAQSVGALYAAARNAGTRHPHAPNRMASLPSQ
jgi:hypothetical protein